VQEVLRRWVDYQEVNDQRHLPLSSYFLQDAAQGCLPSCLQVPHPHSSDLAVYHRLDWAETFKVWGHKQKDANDKSFTIFFNPIQQERIKVFAWVCHYWERLGWPTYLAKLGKPLGQWMKPQTMSPQQRSNSLLVEQLSAMFHQESTTYKSFDYMNSEEIVVCPSDRKSLRIWGYSVIAHCRGIDRSVVAAAISYFDRFLSSSDLRARQALNNKFKLQLVFVASLVMLDMQD
jgi:hypothetical protein